MTKRYDVVIIGAGAAGCTVAGRLSENTDISVLLLEAGPVPAAGDALDLLTQDAGTLRAAAPGHPLNWDYPGKLTSTRSWGIARGRVLGGSMAINGGYFTRAHPWDFNHWAQLCGQDPLCSPWSYQNALPVLCAMETDFNFPSSTLHGDVGPMHVERAWLDFPESGESGPLDSAFVQAAEAMGASRETDKNAGASPGVGPVPLNSAEGVRRHPGHQYVMPVWDRPNLKVRGDARVLRIESRGNRVTGVRVAATRPVGTTRHQETIEAGEVVLAAGAIATPQLLMLSGIGAADHLAEYGIRVLMDRPGVGRGISDHPDISLQLRTRPGLRRSTAQVPITVAWNHQRSLATSHESLASHVEMPGDVETLLTARPTGSLFSVDTAAEGEFYTVMVGLQRAESRGQVRLRSGNPWDPPGIEYELLARQQDIVAMREGLDTTLRALRSGAFDGLVEDLPMPPGTDLTGAVDDEACLDKWIRNSVALRFHTCGGAQMGPESKEHTVADPQGRVLGVYGLRVADLSALPVAPSRGPANTAVFLGEKTAQFIMTPDSRRY